MQLFAKKMSSCITRKYLDLMQGMEQSRRILAKALNAEGTQAGAH